MKTSVTHHGRTAETLSQEEVCRRLKEIVGDKGIQKFILFGSFARGTQTAESDVDLVVVVDTDKPFLDRYDDILLFLHEKLRPHAVSPLIYTPEELEQMRQRPFGVVPAACKEGVIVNVDREKSD